MPNDLVPIDVEGGEVGWSRGTGVDQWTVVYANVVCPFPSPFPPRFSLTPFVFSRPPQLDAVRKLYDILLVKDPYLCPDPFPLAAPPPESHTRAPCANDGCLFSTSMTPFPHPSILSYPSAPPPRPWWSPTRGKKPPVTMADVEHKFDPWKVASVREYEDKWAGVPGGWPSDKWWTEKGSWHLAVDGKGHLTCWESWRREFYLFSGVFPPSSRRLVADASWPFFQLQRSRTTLA